ncbi:FecCD family ABC transporter permease [Hyphomonas sp. NPDC076900]|uniref:FecCD family ABC transporter permease n=1 Tax=unclassified Hyphomonas TaxID=2630699 RepID=UPI003D0838B3
MQISAATLRPEQAVTDTAKWLLGAGALLVMAALSLMTGPVAIGAGEVFRALFGNADAVTNTIIRELRLPRLMLTLGVGAMLGGAGAALQGYLRNPLAEPSILGVASAAALGAVVALYFGLASVAGIFLPLMAAVFALAATLLLFVFTMFSASGLSLILAGIAIGSLAGAGISLALNLSPNPFAAMEITFWLLGSAEDRSWRHVGLSVPLIGLCLAVLFSDRRALDALTLGEDAARALGYNLTLVRMRLIVSVALGVGAAVSVTGAIGFVGLVAPHLARSVAGSLPSRLIAPSALMGALLLTAADILVRLIPTTNELRLGVVTALIGAPFLVIILYRTRRREA